MLFFFIWWEGHRNTKPSIPNPRFETFDLQKHFVPKNPGGNFSCSLGLGVVILLEQNSGSNLKLPASLDPQQALIRIARVEPAFLGKEVIDNVMV